MKASVHLALA